MLIIFRFQFSLYQHAVAIRKEVILFFDGFLVGVQNVLATGERAYEHDERAFGRVEIREHLVHALETVAGIHEDVRRA